MVLLDANIVIVALPSIDGDLGFSDEGLQWVISAYALTFAGVLLLGLRRPGAADRGGEGESNGRSTRRPPRNGGNHLFPERSSHPPWMSTGPSCCDHYKKERNND
jgi:hypothetical protein